MTPNRPKTLEPLKQLSHRSAILAVLALGTLNACGDSHGTNNTDAGMTETDAGTDTGGTDTGTDSGNDDPCYLVDPTGKCDDLYVCEGEEGVLLARDLMPGDTGTYKSDLPNLGDSTGVTLHVDSPDVVRDGERLVLFRAAQASGYEPQGNETQLATFAGINANLVDREDPFTDTCAVKGLELGDSVRVELDGVFSTVYHEKDGVLEQSGENGFEANVDDDGTKILTPSFSNLFVVDTPPQVQGDMPSAMKMLDGKIRVTLNPEQFKDEDHVLSSDNMRLQIGNVELTPIGGGVWESMETMDGASGSIELSVIGANGKVLEHAADQALLNLDLTEEMQDPCEDVDCNGNGTCNEGTCECDEGYADDSCGSCDTGYEGYPNCTPDVTPPNPPVITTNGGADWAVNQADFTLDGTTDADTHEMWYQIDGGAWNLVNGYNSFNTDWSYDGNIPNNFESHDYCFRAEDEADNQSGVDCIEVIRLP